MTSAEKSQITTTSQESEGHDTHALHHRHHTTEYILDTVNTNNYVLRAQDEPPSPSNNNNNEFAFETDSHSDKKSVSKEACDLELGQVENGSESESKQDCDTDNEEGKKSVFKSLGFIDRFLYIWIFLAMAIGIILGNFVPNTGHALEKGKFVGVAVPIAIGLILMIYPILCNIEYEVLHHVFAQKKIWMQLAFSLFMNWIIGPFLMMALAWAFLPDKPELREGLILVGLARCIAMVLIWNGLAGGDSHYGAILVSVNSILQMILYAPYSLLLIKVISRSETEFVFSYSDIAKSVGVFLGIPLAAGLVTRFGFRRLVGAKWYDNVFMEWMGTLSLIGLLFVILVLFASQGERVVDQIVSVVRVAAPMFCYFNLIFFSTLAISYKMGFGYKLSVTQSFTASSNNFELAIAIAVATFGHDSNQALAATVGPLMEVPCLLGLVYVVRYIGNRKNWND